MAKKKTPKKIEQPDQPKPEQLFLVLVGCNSANGDRFEPNEKWPVSVLTKDSLDALAQMKAIELIDQPE